MLKLSPELIKKLDQYAKSPDLLASDVYNFLKEADNFDTYQLQCFCVEFLSASLLNGELLYTEESIKRLAKDFYFAHYLRVAEGICSDKDVMKKDGS